MGRVRDIPGNAMAWYLGKTLDLIHHLATRKRPPEDWHAKAEHFYAFRCTSHPCVYDHADDQFDVYDG